MAQIAQQSFEQNESDQIPGRGMEETNVLLDKIIFVTYENKCFQITTEKCMKEAQLNSSHEEADTRLLLHALQAAESGSRAVVINAEDTDVLILCLGLSSNISCSLYQKCGTKSRTRYIDISKLSQALGSGISNALIGMHAFTGCDTVSAFAGRGKISMFKQMKSNEAFQEAFNDLGQFWELSEELFLRLQMRTCKIYMPSATTTEVNKLRYQIFCAKRGEVESSQLPPCKDCLYMQALRANYQAAVWRRSLQAQPHFYFIVHNSTS